MKNVINWVETQQFGEIRDPNGDYSVTLFFDDGTSEVTPDINPFEYMGLNGYKYIPEIYDGTDADEMKEVTE